MGRAREPTDRKGKMGKARARERTAKGKAREMEINEVVKRAENPQKADASSVGGSITRAIAPRSPRPLRCAWNRAPRVR